jgi:hypothetical protein
MNMTRIVVARSVIWSSRLVEHVGQVVHPGHERDALGPVAVLDVLLDAGVQIADHRAHLDAGLPLEFQHQPEHAVRGGVLRTHVHDDLLVGQRVDAAGDAVPIAAGDREDAAFGGLAFGGVSRGCHW